MGCSSCGGSQIAVASNSNMVNNQRVVQQEVGPCDYTNDILIVWADKLKWFKNKGLYVKYNISGGTINKYLGIILTSININNKCKYRDLLDNGIKQLITFITGLQSV